MAGRDHGGRSQPAPFLTKTWSIVSDPATDKIISWTEDGTSFIIHNQADFSRDILPSWFKHNNFSSFVRQLNIYGFKKVTSARHEFHHQCFRRDDQSLLKHIQRTSQGSNMQYEAVAYENVMLKQQIAHCGQLITWCLEQLGKVGINLPGYLQASGLPGLVAAGQLPSTEGSQQQVLKPPGVAGLEGAAAAASAALPEPPQPGAAVGEEAGAEVAATEAEKADPPKFKAAPGSLAYLQQQSEMAGKRKAGEEGGCSDEDGEKGEEDGKELAASKRQRRFSQRGAEVAAAAASGGLNAAAGELAAGQMADPVQVSAALAAAVPGLNSAGLEAVQAALTAAGSQAAGGGMAAMPASSGVAELVALNQLLKNPGSMAALAGNPVLLQAGAAGNLQSLLGLAQAVHSPGAPLPASSGQAAHAGLLPAAASVPLPSLPPSGAAQPAASGATHSGLGLAEAGDAAGVAAMSASAPMPQPLAAQPAVLAGGQQQGMASMGQEPFLVTIPTTDGGTQLALVSNNSLVTLGQQAAPQVQMPPPDQPAPAP